MAALAGTIATTLALALSPPTPTPTGAAGALAQHIPPSLLPACSALSDIPSSATAAIECEVPNGEPHDVAYVQFPDASSMSAFAAQWTSGKPTSGTSCDTVAAAQSGGSLTYTVNGAERGTLWCYTNNQNEIEFVWTDDTLNIATIATEPQPQNFARFFDWYRGAGPLQ